QMIANPGNFNFDVLLMLAKNYQKNLEKNKKEYPKTQLRHKQVPLYPLYFDKRRDESIGTIEFPIIIQSIRENELIFSSSSPIMEGTILQVFNPVPFYITVVPHSEKTAKDAGKESFRGLIHGIGEVQKKELRKFINSVFFRDLENQKKQELEEFKNKNEEVLKQRTETEEDEVQDQEEINEDDLQGKPT
ncbi:MAG: hypothetical protein ACOCUH_00525, partial [Bacteriovoracia bacterium]